MTVTAQHRDRLTEVRERTRAGRQHRAEAQKALEAAKKMDDPQAVQACEVALQQAFGEIEMAQGLENALLHQMAGVGNGVVGQDSFLDDPAVIRELEQLADSSMPIGTLNLGPAMSRETLVSMIETGTWGPKRLALSTDPNLPDTARQTQYFGVVPQLRRRLRLLDLIPTMTMEGRSFDYTRESGSLDTAAETAELALKPQADEILTDAQVVARTIAHWSKLARQQLADVPSLATVVQGRLTYGVLRRVENAILAGDGVGENLLGILNTTGIADVVFAGGTPLTDLSLTGIVDVLLADAEPNAVILNPADWASMLAAKAVGSGERLDSAGAFSTQADTIWGLTAIPSTAMPLGEALVGDFTGGATLFVREGINLRVSDSDQDDFLRNRVTLLAEGRWGLAVWQPAAFAVVHLA